MIVFTIKHSTQHFLEPTSDGKMEIEVAGKDHVLNSKISFPRDIEKDAQ